VPNYPLGSRRDECPGFSWGWALRVIGYLDTDLLERLAVRVGLVRIGQTVRFEVKDVATLDEEARYDPITTFDAVHDQADPAAVLRRIANALIDDSVYLMQDIDGSSHHHNNPEHPIGPFLYTISTLHRMTFSLAQDGEGLGAIWGKEKAEEMLEEAGLAKAEIEQLPHEFQNYYYIATKGQCRKFIGEDIS
jgi:hypothetical protein